MAADEVGGAFHPEIQEGLQLGEAIGISAEKAAPLMDASRAAPRAPQWSQNIHLGTPNLFDPETTWDDNIQQGLAMFVGGQVDSSHDWKSDLETMVEQYSNLAYNRMAKADWAGTFGAVLGMGDRADSIKAKVDFVNHLISSSTFRNHLVAEGTKREKEKIAAEAFPPADSREAKEEEASRETLRTSMTDLGASAESDGELLDPSDFDERPRRSEGRGRGGAGGRAATPQADSPESVPEARGPTPSSRAASTPSPPGDTTEAISGQRNRAPRERKKTKGQIKFEAALKAKAEAKKAKKGGKAKRKTSIGLESAGGAGGTEWVRAAEQSSSLQLTIPDLQARIDNTPALADHDIRYTPSLKDKEKVDTKTPGKNPKGNPNGFLTDPKGNFLIGLDYDGHGGSQAKLWQKKEGKWTRYSITFEPRDDGTGQFDLKYNHD